MFDMQNIPPIELVVKGGRLRGKGRGDEYESLPLALNSERRLMTDPTPHMSGTLLSATALGTGDTVCFTTQGKYRDCSMYFANISGSASNLTVYFRKDSAGAADATALLKTFSLDDGDYEIWTGFNMDKDTIISGISSVDAAINCWVFGERIK